MSRVTDVCYTLEGHYYRQTVRSTQEENETADMYEMRHNQQVLTFSIWLEESLGATIIDCP